MPMKPDREYRVFAAPMRAADEDAERLIVRGYASTFDPYVLYEEDGMQYCERVDPHAFDDADMSDVILQYDHEGRVFARQSNGTLQLSVDDHGLAVVADLSKTSLARGLYEDIRAGMITRMSFCFTIADLHYENGQRSTTQVIDRMRKIYDVSAVSIPANPGTDIAARSLNGAIERMRAERLAQRRRQMTLRTEGMRLWISAKN